ncbi:MAG: hypothetical protein OXC62_08720 [Aestuariivita sp.]|nr:hypothetical protein [Aestuariivita sp.]
MASVHLSDRLPSPPGFAHMQIPKGPTPSGMTLRHVLRTLPCMTTPCACPDDRQGYGRHTARSHANQAAIDQAMPIALLA